MQFISLPSEVGIVKERQGQTETRVDENAIAIERIDTRLVATENSVVLIIEDVRELDTEQRAALRLLERLDERTRR